MNVKIGDFGLSAKLISRKHRRMSVCGTPNYLAPEILDLRKNNGHSIEVDLWAVGVIAFIMLQGKPPFADNDNQGIYSKILTQKYEFNKDFTISSEAKNFIR